LLTKLHYRMETGISQNLRSIPSWLVSLIQLQLYFTCFVLVSRFISSSCCRVVFVVIVDFIPNQETYLETQLVIKRTTFLWFISSSVVVCCFCESQVRVKIYLIHGTQLCVVLSLEDFLWEYNNLIEWLWKKRKFCFPAQRVKISDAENQFCSIHQILCMISSKLLLEVVV
jgi:hypothetical protein